MLGEAKARVLPAKGKSFDPLRIPEAIRDAGFTPGDIEVSAASLLQRRNDMLVLELPGSPREFVLAGGTKAEELASNTSWIGNRVVVTGKLHPSHDDRLPGLTVESYKPADSK